MYLFDFIATTLYTPRNSIKIGWKDGDSFYEQRLTEIWTSKSNFSYGFLMDVVTQQFHTDLTTYPWRNLSAWLANPC